MGEGREEAVAASSLGPWLKARGAASVSVLIGSWSRPSPSLPNALAGNQINTEHLPSTAAPQTQCPTCWLAAERKEAH